MKNLFKNEAMNIEHPNYSICIQRNKLLYERENDWRTPFSRDYSRILFSQGYRRLKHKTQVFFAVENDHICTRSEHVSLVESVSYTIASYLGLNTELTKAIAIGHDLGHAPFGHGGESILNDMCKTYGLSSFWHERNSLRMVDDIEVLEDDLHDYCNLDLTYAVRDGIISHCGEMHQKSIIRRNEAIDLNNYTHPGQYNPYTWEGCVVKMSDKIAYLARDIEDALDLNILKEEDVIKLKDDLNQHYDTSFVTINNSTIMNYFIQDVCHNSSPETGISLSEKAFNVMRDIMSFNYKNIYKIKRVTIHINYVSLILHSIADFLLDYSHTSIEKNITYKEALQQDAASYPTMIEHYISYIEKYGEGNGFIRNPYAKNTLLYNMNLEQDQKQAVIDYISGMTDSYILKIFNELITF